jgi:anti-sigma regulatory factor (Ser/Thr protein kinase)
VTSRVFGNAPEAVSAARHYVVDQLADVPRAIVDEVAVMVSELATNCVRHTDTEFTVNVERDHKRVRVEVTDRGAGAPTLRVPGADEPSGRGLRIVRELADSFGVQPLAGAPGKTVWFVVQLDHAAGPAGTQTGSSAPNIPRA